MGSLHRINLTKEDRIKIIDTVRGKLPVDYTTEMTIVPIQFEEHQSEFELLFNDFKYQKNTCTVLYGTTEEWDAQPNLIAKKGTIYVYLDKDIIVDEEEHVTYIPGIKIGTGTNYLINSPFIGDDVWQNLLKHIESSVVHIQPGEREFWNNKLNYIPPSDELLEFTRD